MKHHRSIVGALTLAGLTLAACGSTATSSGTTSAHQRQVLAVLGSQSGAAGSKSPTAAGGISSDAVGGVMRPVQWPPTFVVDGTLPSLAKEAKVYTVKGGDTAAIAKVAQALGLTGPVTKSPSTPDGFDQWEVVSGTSHLTVNGSAGFAWYLYDDSNASSSVSSGCSGKPIVSPPMITTDQSPTTTVGTVVDTTMPGCVIVPPTPPADRPTSDEAKRIALAVASNLGLDVTNAAVRVDDSYTMWAVSIDPQLGGLPTQGYGLYLGIGSKGKLVYGSGFMGSVSVLDSYPLVTPAEGLTRLSDQNYLMGGGGPYPMMLNAIAANPLAGMSSGSGEASTPSASAVPGDSGSVTTVVDTSIVSTTLATVPGPSTTLAPWVVHISGARLVLVPRWISQTEMLLVPAYEYTATEGFGTWMAIAVSADFLTQALPVPTPAIPPGTPTPEPGMTVATTHPAATTSAPTTLKP